MSAVRIAVSARAKAIDLLAKQFSIVALETGSASEPLGVVALGEDAIQALAHVAAQPETVNALALVAPPTPHTALADPLANVRVPVLALIGTRETQAQANAAAWRKALSNCNITFVYDAGPDMANERPEAVASALADFLRQRERYVVTDRSAKLYP